MTPPLLYSQLQAQLSQWSAPKDKRHLVGFAENVAAILQSESGCLSRWLSYLSHRDCKARSHMERLSYFVHNPNITAEIFYAPLVRQFLKAWEGMSILLTLDTSLLWEQYCLIEVCFVWEGRSFALAQKVMEHGSATVGYEDYRCVLEMALAVLPPNCQVILLADRGFEHGELIRWLQGHQWSWAIRAKSALKVTLANGQTRHVSDLLPPTDEAYLFSDITILKDIQCHLATANVSLAGEPWAVISDASPSLQTFKLYGCRFGGIEPHFKDYKSAGFEVIRTKLRNAQALSRLLMLLAAATIIAISLAVIVSAQNRLASLDWHGQRGLSFFQIGLRELKQLCYQRLPLPILVSLPRCNPPPAYASRKKKERIDILIEFSRVTIFSS
ncbi:MAG: transposase [Cyanothece sp. SIO1E1]|nr:transposase [Cyanothece sp. SIO1E1]